MREKEKKKSNPFLIFTILLLVAIVAIFVIRITLFTPKETPVSIDKYVPDSVTKTEKDTSNTNQHTSEDKNQEYRKNWKDYISIATLHKDVDYVIAPDGRVSNLNVPLINKTDYPIESITLKVNYINPGNSSFLETRNFEIKNVLPGNRTSYPGPESKVKGVTVMCEIIKIHSANFNFCYDKDLSIDSQTNGGFSGNPLDPWKCK
jgi:cytoskeletal protein RodZ